MAESYVSLGALELRLEWELSDEEKRVGTNALEDLSVEAAYHGKAWTVDTVPPIVQSKILAAATRYLKNLEGVLQTRAGDETLVYDKDKFGAGAPHFTTDEIKVIIGVAQGYNPGFGSIQITLGSGVDTRLSEYVPVNYGGRPFPFFHKDDK